jgi:hypothetical protein
MPEKKFNAQDCVKVETDKGECYLIVVEATEKTVKCRGLNLIDNSWMEKEYPLANVVHFPERNKIPAIYRTLFWFFGNAILGLLTLWAFYLVYWCFTDEKAKEKAWKVVDEGLKGGAIFFVFSTIMCSVVLDIIIGKVKRINPIASFFLKGSPFVILAILTGAYFFKVLGVIAFEPFQIGSTLFWITIPASIGYAIIAKYNLIKTEN